MDQQALTKIVDNTIADIQALLSVKGGEYAGSTDKLANFKRGAGLTGCTPLQVLFVYLSKHYDAVATFVRKDASGVQQVLSEPIAGRLDDIINYCILAKAIIAEQEVVAGRDDSLYSHGLHGEPRLADSPDPRL